MSNVNYDNKPELIILGVHCKSDGYPNVKYRVAKLKELSEFVVREINFPFFEDQLINYNGTWYKKFFNLIATGLRFLYAHFYVIINYLRQKRSENIYIPYPAVFLLYVFSLIPNRWRPRNIIVDAFVSLYDTIVTDRQLVASNNVIAKFIKYIERRAYKIADLIIVDTNLNASYFMEKYQLEPWKVLSLPLAIDEKNFQFSPYITQKNECTVLFIGTFVPLQGVEVIAEAATLLVSYPNIRFKLIGYGQTAKNIENILAQKNCQNISWETKWQNTISLAKEIKNADICLGIFGVGEKSQRVWPLKNYMYMAVGRTLITGYTELAKELLSIYEKPAFITTPVGDAKALANAIQMLAENPKLRIEYAKKSKLFFEKNLSSDIWFCQFIDKLYELQRLNH